MIAAWLIVNCKKGIGSYKVARTLGIKQKSAWLWLMMHHARLAMQGEAFQKPSGPGVEVEADEMFIGGKVRNIHSERRRKVTVMGVREHKRQCVLRTNVTVLLVMGFSGSRTFNRSSTVAQFNAYST